MARHAEPKVGCGGELVAEEAQLLELLAVAWLAVGLALGLALGLGLGFRLGLGLGLELPAATERRELHDAVVVPGYG